VSDFLARATRSSLARWAITLAILFYLSTRIDMAATARAVGDVSRWHLGLVLVMVAVDRAVMILRWWLLLRASGNPIGFVDASRLFLVSSFVGSFLPAGVGGDAARAYGLAQGPTTGSEAVASVAVDRMLGVLSLVAMGLVGLVAWTSDTRSDWRLAAALAVLVAAAVAPFWADQWLRWIVPAHRHERSVTRRALKLSDAVGRYRSRRGVLVHVMAWSLVVQVLRIVQAYILALGLGMTVPFGYFLLFMPAGLLMLLLPVSISGFGVPQAAIVWMLQPARPPAVKAVAAAAE